MAEFDSNTKRDFDLEIVHENFKDCLLEDRDIDLCKYLSAYDELARFFRLCGTLFSFVARDLEGKIEILRNLSSKSNAQYGTVSSMIQHETSGSTRPGITALLRLHRASELILEFMNRLAKSTDGDKTSTIAAEVYENTMAKHDTWLVQKMAGLAMYMLPTRKVLLETMCKHDYEGSIKLVQQVTDVGKPVYNLIDSMYTQNKLHN